MKRGASNNPGMSGRMRGNLEADASECAVDFELILEWVRLVVCRTRRHAAGFMKHRENLAARGETDWRLGEIDHWRESPVFTEREKAALALGEAMALSQSNMPPPAVLKAAKRLLNRDEMIALTLDVMAVNDWINAHVQAPIHLLVVEDNPHDRELLKRQLKMAKMEDPVIFATDAEQALSVLDEFRSGARDGALAVLFLDLLLPGMNGVDLLRQIRAMPDFEALPVIVMTTSGDPEHLKECESLNVVSYVEKPVTAGSFTKAVAGIFDPMPGSKTLAGGGAD
ncbi:MAG: response regulator [Methylacidiphilales bacterium]|nr:response regulator [Candidatus Methylacidiphilales bacterium]